MFLKSKKLTAILLSAALLLTSQAFPVFASPVESKETAIKGEYVPGEVLILVCPEVADEKKIRDESYRLYSANDISEEELMDVSDAAESIEKDVLNEAGISSLTETGKTVIKKIHSDTLSTEELLRLYSGKEGVISAEPNYILNLYDPEYEDHYKEPVILTTSPNPTPPLNELQYAFGNGPGGIDVPDWNKKDNKNAEGTVVAVLDSGVDYNHEDLKDVMWDDGLKYPELTAMGGGMYGFNPASDEYEGVNPTATYDPMDINGHGTHCAGVIAAEWNDIGVSGVANGVKIMAVKQVCDDDGRSNISTTIKGMSYINAAKKARVNVVAVNCSFGGLKRSIINNLAVQELAENGVVTCFSAGNDALNNDIIPEGSAFMKDITGEITVDSSDREGDRSFFSNYGIRTTHIYAPGSDILSSVPEREKALVPDEKISLPAKDVSGKECYLGKDKNAGDSALKYENNKDRGITVQEDKGELVVKGIRFDEIDKMTAETIPNAGNDIAVVMEISLVEKLPDLADGKQYNLVISSSTGGNHDEAGQFLIMPYARNRKGEWDLLNYYYIENQPSCLVCNIDNENYDVKDKDFKIRIGVFKYGDKDVLSEFRINRLWITDADKYPYMYESGTSMATPVVTGVVAILAAKYPKDSAGKRAARVLAGARTDNRYKNYCITGGVANVRNSLDEKMYTPVVSRIYAENGSIHIGGYFFGTKDKTAVNIKGHDAEWKEEDLKVSKVVDKEDGSLEIILDMPEGIKRNEEVIVTVTDRGKDPGRNSYSRYLTVSDPGNILEIGDVYERIPIPSSFSSELSQYFIYDSIPLNGAIYFKAFHCLDDEKLAVFRYKEGKWDRIDGIAGNIGKTVAWDGKIVFVEYSDEYNLAFYDVETGNVKRIPFVPEAKDVSPEYQWVKEPLGSNDTAELYFDGKDMLLFRTRYESGEETEEEAKEDAQDESCTAVYKLDQESGKGIFAGCLKCKYYQYPVISHEERPGKANMIYIVGNTVENGLVAERFTLDDMKPELFENILPEGHKFDQTNSFIRGAGVKDGLYIAGPHGFSEEKDGISGIEADNYFLSFAHPEQGFKPCKKRIGDMYAYSYAAVAGYGYVYFEGFDANGPYLCRTPEDTLKCYGDEKVQRYSDPGATLHQTDAEDVGEITADHAKYDFSISVNNTVIAGTKADISAAFTGAAGYDDKAKHRYKITENKKAAKVNKKGILTPKKRGETDVICEQKVKGGSWQQVGEKLHIYIQMPEMEKKKEITVSDAGISAYSFMRKTTYSPTSWKSTNEKVATIDKDSGVITVIKPGKTYIIAEFGSGKTGSKKKYKTKLVIDRG